MPVLRQDVFVRNRADCAPAPLEHNQKRQVVIDGACWLRIKGQLCRPKGSRHGRILRLALRDARGPANFQAEWPRGDSIRETSTPMRKLFLQHQAVPETITAIPLFNRQLPRGPFGLSLCLDDLAPSFHGL